MNDSLDLRNRILKMRKSNNLNVTKKDSLNNNLMSEFESDIKNETKKDSLNNNLMSEFESDIKNETKKETNSFKKTVTNYTQNNAENLIHHKDKTENQNINRTINDNDAQFLMLANKFNEAVEVILELSQKVENLERYLSQNKNIKKNKVKVSSFFNFKILVFTLIIPIIVLSFFTLPLDFLLIKSIIIDILSSI